MVLPYLHSVEIGSIFTSEALEKVLLGMRSVFFSNLCIDWKLFIIGTSLRKTLEALSALVRS